MKASKQNMDKYPEKRDELFLKTHREETHRAGKQFMRSNQVDTLQVVAQQDATVRVTVENGGIVENRNERKGKRYSL